MQLTCTAEWIDYGDETLLSIGRYHAQVYRDSEIGGYAWRIDDTDGITVAYGHAQDQAAARDAAETAIRTDHTQREQS